MKTKKGFYAFRHNLRDLLRGAEDANRCCWVGSVGSAVVNADTLRVAGVKYVAVFDFRDGCGFCSCGAHACASSLHSHGMIQCKTPGAPSPKCVCSCANGTLRLAWWAQRTKASWLAQMGTAGQSL